MPLAPHVRRRLAEQQKRQNEEQSLVLAVSSDTIVNSDSASTSAETVDSRPSTTTNAANNALVHRAPSFLPPGINETSPLELIQHETIQSLRALLKDAEARCDQLQIENASLRCQLDSLAKSQNENRREAFMKDAFQAYESSEEDVSSTGTPLHARHSDTERIDIIAEILEKQAIQQAKLEKTIASHTEQLKSFQWQIDDGKQRQHQQAKNGEVATAVADEKPSQELHELKKAMLVLEKHRRRTKALQDDAERKICQERRIDNAVTREDLLELYETLTVLIERGNVEGETEWKGSEDDLWALRDRAVRRLAIFQLYGEALDEAKALKAYNGK